LIGHDIDTRGFGIDGRITQQDTSGMQQPFLGQAQSPAYRTYKGQVLKTRNGRVEDPELLDRMTEDIRRSMVGTRGFTADYALVITWERMGYGGAAKEVQLQQYEHFRRWVRVT
jgi:hypothetical protein